MKFKRTIASVLTVIFSLTLMGQCAPKTFAEEIPEIITEETTQEKAIQEETTQEKTIQEETIQEETNQAETIQEETTQEETKEELKEKIKKLENEINNLREKTGWSFKSGARLVKLILIKIGLKILFQTIDHHLKHRDEKTFGKALKDTIKTNKYGYLHDGFWDALVFITWNNFIFG